MSKVIELLVKIDNGISSELTVVFSITIMLIMISILVSNNAGDLKSKSDNLKEVGRVIILPIMSCATVVSINLLAPEIVRAFKVGLVGTDIFQIVTAGVVLTMLLLTLSHMEKLFK